MQQIRTLSRVLD